jgi:aminomethyltransferase
MAPRMLRSFFLVWNRQSRGTFRVSEQEQGPGIQSLHTPLYGLHGAAGARMAPFGGWEMPIDYGSIIEEHHATRRAAGLFDLSHMGEFLVTGPGAFAFILLLITNDPAPLDPGQGLYSPMCRDDGTIVDDVIVYHLPGPVHARYLIVVNAANIAKDWAWAHQVREEAGLSETVWLEDQSTATALIALQGPRAEEILIPLSAEPVESLGSFAYAETTIGGIPVNIARTGYTGEDGFEIFVANEQAIALWSLLLDRGMYAGLRPVGLGARDTLRLEARLALYGNDIDDTTTPLEGGLGRWVKLDKPAFRGRDALRRQKEAGLTRKLAGLAMADRAVPRAHYAVTDAHGTEIGQVTSGSYSPTLGKGIALAYLPPAQAVVGTPLQVIIRGQPHPAAVVKTPFYRRNAVAKETGQ